MDTTIDEVKIDIESNSDGASSNLDKLAESITRLQTILSPATTQLKSFNTALSQLKLATSGIDFSQTGLDNLQSSLTNITSIKKPANFTSILAELKEIPNISKSLGTKEISDFVTKIKDLASALSPLATELDKVGNAFSKLPDNITKVNSAIKATNSQAKQSNGGFLSNLFSGFSGATIKVTALVAIMQRLATSIGKAVTVSNQYIENLNLFRVSMGKTTDAATKFTTEFSNALGIDPSNVMRYMGMFNTLAEGFGLSSESAYLMSKNLTQLSYDMSSFLNIPIDKAMQKIKSGFSGEIEPMRAVGIALDQATLQQTAYTLGIDKKITEMTRAQKTELLYYQIMTRTNKMQGDMARTLIQPANALRVTQQQFTLLARAIGNIFLPIIMKVLPYVNVLTQALTNLANRIANFFGFEIPEVDYSSLDGISGAIDDVGDSATETSKKVDRMINRFDDLNVIDFGDDKSSGAGSGSDLTGGSLGIPLPNYDALDGLIETQTEKIKKKIKDFLSNFEGIFKTLSDWINKFKPLLKGLGTLFLSIFAGNIVTKMASFIKKLKGFENISLVVGLFKDAIKVAGVEMSKVTGIGAKLTAGLGSLWASFKTLLSTLSPITKVFLGIGSIAGTFITVYDAVKKLTLGTTDLGTALLNIGAGVTIFGTILSGLLGGPLGLTITAVAALTGGVLAYEKAQRELEEKEALTRLFDGQGRSMESVLNHYDALNEQVGKYSDKIKQNSEDIENNKKTYESLSDDIEIATSKLIAMNGEIDETDLENLINNYKDLGDAAKTNTKLVADGIIQHITKLKELGKIDDETANKMIANTIERQKAAGEETDALTNELLLLDRKLRQNAISAEEYSKQYTEIKGRLDELSGTTKKATEIYNVFSDSLNSDTVKINLETPDAALNFVTSLADKWGEAKQSIQTDIDSINSKYDEQVLIAGNNAEEIKRINEERAIALQATTDIEKDTMADYKASLILTYAELIASGNENNPKMAGVVEELNKTLGEMGNVDLQGKGKEIVNTYVQELIDSGNENIPQLIQYLQEQGINVKEMGWIEGLKLTPEEQQLISMNWTNGAKISDEDIKSLSKTIQQFGIDIKDQYGNSIEFTEQEKSTISKALVDPMQVSDKDRNELFSKIIESGADIKDQYGNSIVFTEDEIKLIHGELSNPFTRYLAEQTVTQKLKDFGFGIPTTIRDAIVEKASEATDEAQNLVEETTGTVYNTFLEQREAMKQSAEGSAEIITESFNAEVPKAKSAAYATGKGAMEEVKNGLNDNVDTVANEFGKAGTKLGDSLSNHLQVNGTTLGNSLSWSLSNVFTRLKNTAGSIFSFLGIDIPSFRWFEDGGFPETGEFFFARESGPELVGTIGNKAAVANNDQITAGIAQASYEGVSQALRENSGRDRQPVNVYIGNDKIYSGYGQYANSQNNMYGASIIKV